MRKIASLLLGAAIAMSASADNYDYEALFWKAREANQRHVELSDASAQQLHAAYIAIELEDTVNQILTKIAAPTADFQAKLDALREAYEGREIIADFDALSFDLWADKPLPIPGGVDPNSYDSAPALLADTDGFRPFLSDFRLADPSSAKGTLIAVPSIRASYSELTAIARIFNDMGYNVFTVLPRLDMSGDINGLNWMMLQLDAQRAIRFVRHHAKQFQLDADKLFLIAGSKGNTSHPYTFEFFDMDPTEIADRLGTSLPGYTPDAIDNELSNVQAIIVSYGTMALPLFNARKMEADLISNSRIYSKQNADKGLKFPATLFLAGNLDWDVANLPDAIKAFYEYNNRKDKLYAVPFEAHLLNGVPHGFGAGLKYPNLMAQWQQIDVFISQVLQEQP